MGDLGALQFVQHFDMLRWNDQQVADTIRYSNVVYNLIGSYKDTNNFSRRLTNVEWAERLATLVAEKDDGTRYFCLFLKSMLYTCLFLSLKILQKRNKIEKFANFY